jgi:hypothetical protein
MASFSLVSTSRSDCKEGNVVTWGSCCYAYTVKAVCDDYLVIGEPAFDVETGEAYHPHSVDSTRANELYIYTPIPEEKPHDRTKIASDGGSTDYYAVPEHATELRHLISHKGMSKSRGDIFKACYRLGEKSGVDTLYDLNKMKFFVEDLIEMHSRGEHL